MGQNIKQNDSKLVFNQPHHDVNHATKNYVYLSVSREIWKNPFFLCQKLPRLKNTLSIRYIQGGNFLSVTEQKEEKSDVKLGCLKFSDPTNCFYKTLKSKMETLCHPYDALRSLWYTNRRPNVKIKSRKFLDDMFSLVTMLSCLYRGISKT